MKHSPPPIRTALICVSDKTKIIDFTRELHNRSIQILATGGTATLLKNSNIPVREVSDYTGFDEILDGRVKTLHPLIHGGILARGQQDEAVMSDKGITPIDLVVVNLYPFQETISKPSCQLSEAIETIDIGGPTLLRAAAKNFEYVTVAVDHADYLRILDSMKHHQGGVEPKLRYDLAVKAFEYTAHYDGAIANYLGQLNRFENDPVANSFSRTLNAQWIYHQGMRYGENPHQKAAFYIDSKASLGSVSSSHQLQGRELSFNNIADTDAAIACVKQFDRQPACAIIKHANPCGVAVHDRMYCAYQNAYKSDPESAFGGIIAFNHELDEITATEIINTQFVEVIVAPSISDQAIKILSQKEAIRVLACGQWEPSSLSLDYKKVEGGLLVQEADNELYKQLTIVTNRSPNPSELRDLEFAWRVVKLVKSNAIVLARDNMTLGIGAGQTSRVNSARIAALKAQDAKLELNSAVMASDAFIPFTDSIDYAAAHGISAVIQPGGSKNDAKVVAAANANNIAMVLTGTRHFKH